MGKKIILAIGMTLVLLFLAGTCLAEGYGAPWWSKEARGEWWSEEARWAAQEFEKTAVEPLFLSGHDYDSPEILTLAERRGWVVMREISRPRIGSIAVWKNIHDGRIKIAVLREINGRDMIYYYYDERDRSPHHWRQEFTPICWDGENYNFVGYIYPERRH